MRIEGVIRDAQSSLQKEPACGYFAIQTLTT